MKKSWIKITDRLPEFSGKYLVAYTSYSNSFAIAYFSDIDNCFVHTMTKNHFTSVTHWQHLVEPEK